MKKISQLTELLKRLNAGEDPASVRAEAQEFLASINPEDLSFAEQKLIEAGLKPEDLRHLCSIHMEMLGEELEKLKKNIKPGHVVYTMVNEHEQILGFLDELEKTNKAVQKIGKYAKKEELSKLRKLSEYLLEADPHHQREEDVLFPELESRGVFGPPQIMRMEHEDLRRKKKELKKIAENAGKMDFNDLKKKLDTVSKFIVLTLRDHIFKENNILYPTAVQVIKEKDVWEKMKSKCDKIGYCSFGR